MTMETIKIDGELIRVDELSEVMQNMTVLFEHIAENEAEARKGLATLEAARMEITRRMVATFKHEQELAAQAKLESENAAQAKLESENEATESEGSESEGSESSESEGSESPILEVVPSSNTGEKSDATED